MSESTQHKLDRIRPPRVQITYDVHLGDAIEMKELPFVGGILADLSGKPEEPLPKVKDRKFVSIDRDNFNEVMSAIGPRLVFQADNKLTDDDSKLNLELKFSHIDDFDPVSVLKQVTPLRKLYEARQRLTDLLTKLDGNDDLDSLLQDVVASTENLQELKSLSGSSGDTEPGAQADKPPEPKSAEPENTEPEAQADKPPEPESAEPGEDKPEETE
ncbi:MAG: type VI secretion system contractile sheath small subunit [Desulfobacterales bacterium]|nr:type VI secretion system contractile sheath small subunit [Desulfobacterales bacterium]